MQIDLSSPYLCRCRDVYGFAAQGMMPVRIRRGQPKCQGAGQAGLLGSQKYEEFIYLYAGSSWYRNAKSKILASSHNASFACPMIANIQGWAWKANERRRGKSME